jgi:hypothetical protein
MTPARAQRGEASDPVQPCYQRCGLDPIDSSSCLADLRGIQLLPFWRDGQERLGANRRSGWVRSEASLPSWPEIRLRPGLRRVVRLSAAHVVNGGRLWAVTRFTRPTPSAHRAPATQHPAPTLKRLISSPEQVRYRQLRSTPDRAPSDGRHHAPPQPDQGRPPSAPLPPARPPRRQR